MASTSEPVVCKVGSTSPACTVGGNGGALPVVEYETAAVAPNYSVTIGYVTPRAAAATKVTVSFASPSSPVLQAQTDAASTSHSMTFYQLTPLSEYRFDIWVPVNGVLTDAYWNNFLTPAYTGPEPWPLRNATAPFSLLVVAPVALTGALAPLVTHKNQTGMPAFLATMEDIRTFGGFSPTQDDALALKSIIRTAVENFGARYVMLVGDATLVPARHYTIVADPGAAYDWSMKYFFPTDLYYANLYRDHDPIAPVTTHGAFTNWDANDDGFFDVAYGPDPPAAIDAAHYNPDDVDGFPDVAVGRVDAQSVTDVTIYVNKVIAYENGQSNPATQGKFGLVADWNYAGSPGIADGLLPATINPASVTRVAVNVPAGTAMPAGWPAGTDADIINQFATTRWITYVGHGSHWGWDSFGTGDLAGLANSNNWPIVVASACDSGAFSQSVPFDEYLGIDAALHHVVLSSTPGTYIDVDQNNEVLGAQFTPIESAIYSSPNIGQWNGSDRPMPAYMLFGAVQAGAIAYIASTQTTQDNVAGGFAGYMMTAYAQGTNVLGDLFVAAQRGYWTSNLASGDYFTAPRLFLNYMELSGDPSLRVQ